MSRHIAISDDGNVTGGEMIEVDGQGVVAIKTMFGLIGVVVVSVFLLTGCAIPLIGVAAGGASAGYSYSERDEISADLIKTTALSIDNAQRIHALEEWAKTKGFSK